MADEGEAASAWGSVLMVSALLGVAGTFALTDLVFVNLADRAGYGLLILGAAAYLWLDRVYPLTQWPLAMRGDEVVPTRRRVRDALRGRGPRPLRVADLQLGAVSWIPADRIPSHCFALVLRSSSGFAFTVDNRKEGADVITLLEALRRANKLRGQPDLVAAMTFWDGNLREWRPPADEAVWE